MFIPVLISPLIYIKKITFITFAQTVPNSKSIPNTLIVKYYANRFVFPNPIFPEKSFFSTLIKVI